jgi:hypothetical protein
MKKIFVLLCFVLSGAVWAEEMDLDFRWGLGDMEAYFSSAAHTIDGRLSLGQFSLVINKKIDLGINLFNMGSISNGETVSYAFLPLKAEYRIVDYKDILGINLYGKAAWQFIQKEKDFNPFASAPNSGFYGGAGLEFLLRLPLVLHYEGAVALFVEYGIPEGFKAGLRVDILSLAALVLVSTTWF